ncbi:MAG: RluA family pseudouridine synthase [Calditerrivibrio sp.]|nr:RluA family pseudouridine synthase [Calditerrivibrio sp.]MCA1932633.1 RluA family pseudouridine synthase [Calditerrivibrio sp.]
MSKDVKIIEEIRLIAEDSGKRIDQYLFSKLGYSRSFFKNIIDDGLVLLNGKICKASSKVNSGDVCLVKIPDESIDLTPKDIPFNVLEDNQNYAVIDKPAGLVVHPAPGNNSDTLVNGILHRFVINDDENCRPGIVHRLDKDTSGVMIIAKNRDARQKLSSMFADRDVIKEYIAICSGNPERDSYKIENYIGRCKNNRQKMAVVDEGKIAISNVEVIDRGKNIFICRVRIFTGRTHQIRVHMSHIGFPLIGDELYGGKKVMSYGISRQALHSSKISFTDPFKSEFVSFESALPFDMLQLIAKYGLKY